MAQPQSLKEYYKFDAFAFGNGFGGTIWGSLTYYMGIPIAFLTFVNASKMQIGLVTALFWAGFAIPQVWAAYATETYKIKKMFMIKVLMVSNIAWLIMGVYILVTKAANQQLSAWLFLIMFAWAAAVVGMFIPPQFSLIFKITPTDRLGHLLGILFAVQFLGIALGGPVIAFVNSKFAAPTNYAVLFLMTFVITFIISLILISIKEPEGEEFEGSPSFSSFIGDCFKVFFEDRILRKFIIGKWIMSGHYLMLAFMIAFLIQDRGFDPLNAGWFTSLHGLGLFVGGFTITKIADIYGPKQMLVTSHIFALIYTLIVWLIPSSSPVIAFTAFAITGLAQISDNVGYSNMCMLSCPTLDKSKYIAVTNVGVNLLVVPLPIIVGKLLDLKVLDFNTLFAITVGMMVTAIIYVIFVVENPKAFLDMKAAK